MDCALGVVSKKSLFRSTKQHFFYIFIFSIHFHFFFYLIAFYYNSFFLFKNMYLFLID